MFKVLKRLKILPAALVIAASCAWGGENPVPTTEEKAKKAVFVADPAAEMPEALYKELRGLLEKLEIRPQPDAPKERIEEAKKEAKSAEEKLRELTQAQEPTIIKALRSPQPLHRAFAAYVLRHARKECAVQPLAESLKNDDDQWTRRAACDSLSQLGDVAAVPALIEGLEDQDSEIRARCAAGLGKLADARAVEPLLTILKGNDLPAVRLRAAAALGKIKDKNALDAMNEVLEREADPRVRMVLAEAVREVAGKDTELTKLIPKAEEQENALHELARDMTDVESKLRQERHDREVQVVQKDIDDRLAKLIQQVQEMQQQAQQGQQKQQQQKKKQGGQQQQPRIKEANSPMQQPSLEGTAQRGALRAAETTDMQESWAKLPPAAREEIMSVNRDEVPERWRKRLAAYILSINEGETQK
jgi:HEAT repeat protein